MPNLWDHWMDLSQTWDTYSLMTAIWKIWSKVPQAFTPTVWGQKTLFGADFEIWPKISLQRNMISTIGKKLANLQGLPYMPAEFGELWSTNRQTAEDGWRVFANPLKFACKTSCRLTFTTHFGLIMFARWRLWSTQMLRAWLALVRLRSRRVHARLCHVSSW